MSETPQPGRGSEFDKYRYPDWQSFARAHGHEPDDPNCNKTPNSKRPNPVENYTNIEVPIPPKDHNSKIPNQLAGEEGIERLSKQELDKLLLNQCGMTTEELDTQIIREYPRNPDKKGKIEITATTTFQPNPDESARDTASNPGNDARLEINPIDIESRRN